MTATSSSAPPESKLGAPAVRKIIHIDMDAFYASVEVRDNPALKGLPVVVGGQPNSRAVVMAASYEARAFGIRSAMPCSRAARLCPQVVFVPPDFSKYQRVSGQIHEIFQRYTPRVEGLSLDEAFLDVTENRLGLASATEIARRIKADIRRETGLTASAGVAGNKFLAKVASEEKKPDGLFVIRPDQARAFLARLPLAKVPGIGKVTQQQLADLGLITCGDLEKLSRAELGYRFGRRGEYFYRMARGEDDRAVEPGRERKSVGIEDTFAEDHDDAGFLRGRIVELADGLAARARRSGVRGRTVTLKLKTADFRIFTRSRTLPEPTDDAAALQAIGVDLLARSGLLGQKLRLLGLSLHHLEEQDAPAAPDDAGQLAIPFDDASPSALDRPRA